MNDLQAFVSSYPKEGIIDIPYTRHDMARFFADWNLSVGAEIGVERARFSEVLCTLNPSLKLYAVDPWRAYRGYRDHVSQEKLDAFYAETIKRMSSHNCQIIRASSVDAAMMFEDETLDFVYIDANHKYENVKEDIAAWFPKVRKGGILSGHDYIRRKGQADLYGVVEAVQEFVRENQIAPLYIWRGDKSPSWMIIKP